MHGYTCTCKEGDGEVGGGFKLSQHGRETRDGEVQRWVYELESQMEQRQLFNEGHMGQGDRYPKGQEKGKSSDHNYSQGSKESQRGQSLFATFFSM